MKTSARDIAFLLAKSLSSPFYYRKHMCVIPRVSWGFLNHEADIVAVTKSGYFWEAEIKISVSDFKADARKEKWKQGFQWRGFYYVVSEDICNKVKSLPRPDRTGLISVGDDLKIISEAEINSDAKPLSVERQMTLMRLGCMRLWDKEVITKFYSEGEG